MTNPAVRAFADDYWEQLLEQQPLVATGVGDERFDHLLPDPGPAGRAAQETLARSSLAKIDELDGDGLEDGDRVTIDLMAQISKRMLSAVELRTDRLEVANHMLGSGTMLAHVASLQQVDTPERLDRYEERLRRFPDFLDASSDVAREAASSGVTAPMVIAERTVAQLERILALPVEGSPAMQPVPDEAKDRIEGAVREAVNPALESFLEVMRADYLPAATETIALTALPDGDAMYAAEIAGWVSLELQPRDVHQLGLDRLEAIQAERHAVAARLGYPSPADAVAAHTESGANTFATAEELVGAARDQVARSWEIAPRFFGRLPRANCEVRRVEEFREADEAFAFYNSPTEDGSRPGLYYINAYDLADRAKHHVASVTYHEANPGHHFQIALEQEMPERPAIRRFGGYMAASSFAEGWGLYSERLADDMGLYLDEWERLGMLDNQAHRAARLITDTGIHALGWSRERAIATLEDAGQTHTDAVIEVDRYIGMPAQALSYMIGMIEIEKARDHAREVEGPSFSLMAFHDRVLAQGGLPLPTFRRVFGTS